MRIFKYALEVQNEQVLEMPKDAWILDIQVQYGIPTLWALVDPEAVLTQRKILCVGTGHEVAPGSIGYLATVQMGTLVWHFFEV